MLLFAAAIVGILSTYTKVAAVNAVVNDHLQPAQVAILRTEFLVRTAAIHLVRYTLERDTATATVQLTGFRQDVTDFDGDVGAASNLAQDDTQRAAVADFRQSSDSWKQQNEATLALRAAGQYAEAEKAFLANPSAPLY